MEMRHEALALAREGLREAISAKTGAEAEVEDARRALARANDALSAADSELAEFERVDADIRSNSVEEMKAAIRAGRNAVAVVETGEGRAPARARIEWRTATARQTRDEIAAELKVAEARVRDTAIRVQLAAVDVLKAEAEMIAADLKASQERTWRLNAILAGFANVWIVIPGERGAPIRLSREVLAMIDRPEPQYAPMNEPRARAAKDWRALLAQLARDPDAVLHEIEQGASPNAKAA
jgi:anti-sigma28 factor (negative regulator of flagellin synthesis)